MSVLSFLKKNYLKGTVHVDEHYKFCIYANMADHICIPGKSALYINEQTFTMHLFWQETACRYRCK